MNFRTNRSWIALSLTIVVLVLAGYVSISSGLFTPSNPIAMPTPTTVALNSTPTPATASPTATQSAATSTPGLASNPTATPIAAAPIPSPEEMLSIWQDTDRPPADLADLVQRLKLPPGEGHERTVSSSGDYQLGQTHEFHVMDQQARQYYTVNATIRWVTPHAYFYVQDGEQVSNEQLQRTAEAFENNIYPTVHRYFGSEWTPGVDNDPRITILNARIPGVGGYFSSLDEYTKQVNPFSNQREMIYINLGAVQPGSERYDSILAHEFQHMVHWNTRPSNAAWLNEGASELAIRLAGYAAGGFQSAFLSNPDTQLNTWAEEPSLSLAHYGGSYLFLSYLAERSGSYEAIKDILALEGRGQELIDSYLQNQGLSFDQVFQDWVVTNYLNDAGIANGRYTYRDINPPTVSPQRQDDWQRHDATVNQYAADYIELAPPAADFEVIFAGQPLVKAVSNDAHSGQMQWWSNRGDIMNSSLTRRFDLTNLDKATLQFWTWFDIEKEFDQAYVTISEDDGQTWQTLAGQHSSTGNPLGTNFGNGYTGKSGDGSQSVWVQEQIDLTPFVGKQVLLRFEYVTDDVFTSHGFCLDDISIPELGFHDTVEEQAHWEAQGFIRLNNALPQRYAVQLVSQGQESRVESVSVDADGRGRVAIRGLGQDIQKAVLVVAALTPGTTEPASYSVTLQPLSGQ